jgi:hypothetical protein
MKLRLTRDCRVRHSAGEIVEVSPVHAAFLLSTHSAVVVPEIPAAPALMDLQRMEEPENPEKTAKAAKTTRKK